MSINHFCIAEHHIRIIYTDQKTEDMELLPSLEPFRESETTADLLFRLTIDNTLSPVKKEQRERIRGFDTGNGITIVDRLDDGGYQYIIKDIKGNSCCLLQTNKDFSDCKCALNGNRSMRFFGLNNALMLIYAFAGSTQQTLLIHASLIKQGDYGYAFIAKSGTGKSTHASMWLQHLSNCELMNDDNPVIRIIDNEAYIYGSPWSGKTPCYRNIKAKLGAITRIDRAKTNSIDHLSTIEAFASILPSCSSMKWDKTIFNNICNTITQIISKNCIYTMHCLPNKEAATICNKEISK